MYRAAASGQSRTGERDIVQGAVKEPKLRPSAVGEGGDRAQQGEEKRRQKEVHA